MHISKQTLLELLNEEELTHRTSTFTPSQMAHLFVNSALLVEVMGFLKEQLWLKNKEDKELGIKTSYEDFMEPLFSNELESIIFLKDFLIKSGSGQMKKVGRDSKEIEQDILSLITSKSKENQKEFVIQSLKEMKVHFLNEEESKESVDQNLGQQGLRLYRTFDNLDDIFELNYNLDLDMTVDHDAKERLYQKSGVGVQSGYSTILLALHSMKAALGSTVVDLGSGYGRVGLVCSLVRPDINFIGYEYVPHRVDVSNEASEALGLQASLIFKTQDLSLESFSIPDADFYYLYDPFSEETYRYILEQIVEVSKRKEVTIVTKGNARNWLKKIAKEQNWPNPIYIDESNLCIFRSFIS
ncbi:hypothetical protein [Halobacteriovorax sp. JY17]|uniref:hypothetical protein n=1 Tax=Halobacteriovorax sp. JY17 TaxID=2014617 RepID=UPI000C5C9BED|nr:hypothetical protein [Halobacteriovorax sp. JY17]PIK13566.1 MAG: SAM-dependent methyltransferase [Halobacteriovorax sp. JY17]